MVEVFLPVQEFSEKVRAIDVADVVAPPTA
jgi:hypothetical protein